MREHPGFELTAPPRYGLVCFAMKARPWGCLDLGGAALQRGAARHTRGAASAARWRQPGTPACEVVLLQGASDEDNAALLEAINGSGKAFLVHTVLAGRYTLRMAIGASHTQVRTAWSASLALLSSSCCRPRC